MGFEEGDGKEGKEGRGQDKGKVWERREEKGMD
jgi:hypothetical protein